MPLIKGAKPGSKNFGKNIATEIKAGKKLSQAQAIAYSESGEKKMKQKSMHHKKAEHHMEKAAMHHEKAKEHMSKMKMDKIMEGKKMPKRKK